MKISFIKSHNRLAHSISLIAADKIPSTLSKEEKTYFQNQVNNKAEVIGIHHYPFFHVFVLIDEKKIDHNSLEKCRRTGASVLQLLNANLVEKANLINHTANEQLLIAFIEGLYLSSYRFNKYKSSPKKKNHEGVSELFIEQNNALKNKINETIICCNAVFYCRDLVNEPFANLNAPKLAKSFLSISSQSGFHTEILNKNKIASLKMNGLLTVNKGSKYPPSFSILKKSGVAKTPTIVLVGKGVVYDTGGYNIKVSNGMETMKCDMAGAAAVGAVLKAVSENKLNCNLVGLVPATDNSINSEAYVAGDIIKYSNGVSVEVLNTDAEGRLILADALIYANKFKPDLVIDLATLTGAAAAAIGKYGAVAVTNSPAYVNQMQDAASNTGDRLTFFPFWSDYEELIKSDIADIKNIGGPYAGAITAGKFLEKFTDYPWIHLDIAGPAFIDSPWNYRTKGATGYGVRLLYHFIKNFKIQPA